MKKENEHPCINVLHPSTIEYYEWHEIRKFLCGALSIEEKYFRRYHEVVGGEYKDFWHLWIWLVDERIMNDSYMPTYISHPMQYIRETADPYFIEQMKSKFGVGI